MSQTLAGDVLLLAVGERGRWRSRGDVGTVLAGALLCEGVLAGQGLSDATPAPRERHRRFVRLVQLRARGSAEEVAARLGPAVAPVEHRVLGLFPRRGYEVVDAPALQGAARRLEAALAPGSRPAAEDACLAVLCAVSGIARSYAPLPGPDAERATAEHLNALAGAVGAPAAEVLRATRAAYRRRGRADDGVVPLHGGYGDEGGVGSGASDGGGGGGDGGGDGGGGGGGGG